MKGLTEHLMKHVIVHLSECILGVKMYKSIEQHRKNTFENYS